ncbi:transcription factor IIIB 60 kDa subunit isoform X2 [Telopea speciosissima]|uniref:transcription factor IIIB 60 kDa subunit isoform X2 n=1 Tax=Telopea speciosissima TaxID=54955 RepID=UPI001CC4D001|nr:transcription factor IIIB 60 kDa subunit isoform X2 [Telopea speciosissima]
MGWCKHCAKNRQMERDPINGFLCCSSCGRVIDQDVFSTEVTFIKGAGGQSQMSGNFVRTVQGEHSESHERTLNKGRDEISDMVVSLGIGGGNSIIDPAFAFYKIAVERNFTRGRRTSQVAAACLYIACRENKKAYLLIDFSDYLQINVYVLGAVFLQLCKLLRLEEHPIVQKPVDPSLFIHRFTERLLGGKNIEVSRAALRIIASMKRDWMQTGRKPSGLCGAALYISALSHGLRYSKSDVVSVVHICEATLTKRLIEFENTASGGLTIEEFNMKAEELENELHSKQQLNVGSKMSEMTELLCEHKGRGDAHFAHGLCKLCYKDFVELSGGLQGGSEPPAFERAERERMAKASIEGVEESSPGSTHCHRDNEQKQFEKEEESVRENPPDVIENDRMDSDVFVQGLLLSINLFIRMVPVSQREMRIWIMELVDGYLHNEEEKHYKKIIWEEMNREYLEEQAAKEAAAAAVKEAQESDLQNCSEDLLNARELAAATAAAVAKSRKERKQKRAANSRNGIPAQTAAEATREMLTKKRLSSKINYEVLEKLFDDSTAPENSKKKRVESDPDNDAYGPQISEESGEKEVVSDVVDNNDDFREDDYEEGDGELAYGDGSYYGNEEDGYDGYHDDDY